MQIAPISCNWTMCPSNGTLMPPKSLKRWPILSRIFSALFQKAPKGNLSDSLVFIVAHLIRSFLSFSGDTLSIFCLDSYKIDYFLNMTETAWWIQIANPITHLRALSSRLLVFNFQLHERRELFFLTISSSMKFSYHFIFHYIGFLMGPPLARAASRV